MRKQLPYFKWYPADAEMDDFYSCLTDQELGFYHRCLNRSWINGGLPSDLDTLAAVMRVRRSYLDRIWMRVGQRFYLSDDSTRFLNRRQEEERNQAIQKSESAGQSAAQQQKIKVPGFVYLIQRGDGLIKIGSSNNVPVRLAQLKYKYRESMELIGFIPVDSMGDVEISLHLKYKPQKVTGEWYSITPEDTAEILAITPRGDMKGDIAHHPSQQALARAESAAVSVSQEGGAGGNNVRAADFSETATAIRGYFPAADDAIVAVIVNEAFRSYADTVNGHGRLPPLTDALIAEAVHEAHFKKQTSPALFREKVPRVVKSWAEKAIRTSKKEPAMEEQIRMHEQQASNEADPEGRAYSMLWLQEHKTHG